jgi:ABC-2 type transport system ATP-binding protein
MRSIVGVQVVESGAVRVLGHPAGSSPLRSRVGYVTQAPAIYDDLTVEANLKYFARIFNVPKARIGDVVETVGLAAHAHKLVRNLSGGQRARVSLATALLNQPEVLILDEPTVGLDPVLRAELWGTFHRLANEGATLLISSHVMDEAERCDRLVLLRDGHVLANGTPSEILRQATAATIEEAFLHLVRKEESAA